MRTVIALLAAALGGLVFLLFYATSHPAAAPEAGTVPPREHAEAVKPSPRPERATPLPRRERTPLPRETADAPDAADDRGTREASRAQRRAELMQRFDKDDDGQLSAEEREAMRRARRERQQDRMLEAFDDDGNGELDEDERAMRDAAREKRVADRAQRAMETLDADTDGTISLAEAEAGGRRGRQFVRRFSEIDENGDGHLDSDELAASLKQRFRRSERESADGDRGDEQDARSEGDPPARRVTRQ
jgi:Ca2+-binding EF-hand superfamily protein